MNKFFLALSFLGLASSAAFSASPRLSDVYINSISVNGSGCLDGSISGEITSDSQLNLYFDDFFAEAGRDVSRVDDRKFCQISLNLHVPDGWQYALYSAKYEGYAVVDRGAYVNQTSTYYFQGDLSETAEFNSKVTGPFQNSFKITDTLRTDAVWSPCGINRSLNIKTSIMASARGGKYAWISLDSFGTRGGHKYGLQWRRCN